MRSYLFWVIISRGKYNIFFCNFAGLNILYKTSSFSYNFFFISLCSIFSYKYPMIFAPIEGCSFLFQRLWSWSKCFFKFGFGSVKENRGTLITIFTTIFIMQFKTRKSIFSDISKRFWGFKSITSGYGFVKNLRTNAVENQEKLFFYIFPRVRCSEIYLKRPQFAYKNLIFVDPHM